MYYNTSMHKELRVPPELMQVAEKLRENSFDAYLIGGCVRDLILEREPKDWELTTNAVL